jgi:hypothetical protein
MVDLGGVEMVFFSNFAVWNNQRFKNNNRNKNKSQDE